MKDKLNSVLSRLFLGGAAPPIRMTACKADLSVFNNYYQTVIHMQVHSNQIRNSDTRGG